MDLTLILRNTENASRDAKAALGATERLTTSVGSRLSAMEARFLALETRFAALETRYNSMEGAIEGVAQSNLRIVQLVTDVIDRLPPA